MLNHLWQSTLFAVAAGLLTLAFRRNRAQVRYWLWFSASAKFLVPFTLLIALGTHVPRPAAQRIAIPAVSYLVLPALESPIPAPASPAPGRRFPVRALWVCGVAAIVLIRFRGWLHIRAAVRSSIPIDVAAPIAVRSSPGLLEPGVVGLFRPTLLLPAGIADRLTPRQLEAVLAHEMGHVRRRDNLTAAIHMLVEALFWFHPLVWWIGARLVEERERACDEAVLTLGSEPRDYAEAILNVCKLYAESPLACVSGVTGSNLKKRIEAIMTNRALCNLTLAKKAALAAAAAVALAIPITIGVVRAPLRAQSTTPVPKFEVASIKPCASGASGGRGGRSGGSFPAHGNLTMECVTVIDLMKSGWVTWANGHLNSPKSLRIEGGPPWIYSERYTINAKSESDVGMIQMRGPMMIALLEDRLRLKTHRETREIPVYELKVAKGGPKLKAAQAGNCTTLDVDNLPAYGPPDPNRVFCGTVRARSIRPEFLTVEYNVISMAQFGNELPVDRPVIDKTGISGLFDLQLEFELGERTVAETIRSLFSGLDPDNPSDPNIFTALEEQLGLKLTPAKGPGTFLVIDHIEKPSEN
jgi:bla regulator protein blaR1